MKATGIVRRIDDLGRVVIPKEIRRTMRIREGESLEIYTDTGGEVIFKKYSPIGELSPCASQYAEILARNTGFPALICDRDHVVAVSGVSKRDYLDRRITPELEALIDNRTPYSAPDDSQELPPPVEGAQAMAVCVYPILSGGDLSGAVALLTRDDGTRPEEMHRKLAEVAAGFLGSQIES
ncbi:MAG: AbrB/MazE/SpoVT family DNA-binding domain-containing protein [Clostridia bacterium]|nr:AbrB/MazE/SpoVT family DNA-binding domain-containing protein [Clostridia bacterium]MBQ1554034.1 AbrB/MazE/SpoVT family DNA-binding domain-containing protein [Clostridia bacterium]